MDSLRNLTNEINTTLKIEDEISKMPSSINMTFESNEQCVNFFTESIEAFRVSLEKNYNLKKKFILCGHSLGGYFAANYALKYPNNIVSLLLMSSTGITDVGKYGGPFLKI